MDPWVTLIKDIGFPAAVALLVLFRLDAQLHKVHERLSEMCVILGAMAGPEVVEKVKAILGNGKKVR